MSNMSNPNPSNSSPLYASACANQERKEEYICRFCESQEGIISSVVERNKGEKKKEKKKNMHEKKLNNNTLVLFLVDAVVLPYRDTRNRESQERRRGDGSIVLTRTPGLIRGLTRRIARRVLHLLGVAGRVEIVELGLCGFGEVREQCVGEGVGIDGSGDGVADGSAQTVEET